jgi:hypothetical protein
MHNLAAQPAAHHLRPNNGSNQSAPYAAQSMSENVSQLSNQEYNNQYYQNARGPHVQSYNGTGPHMAPQSTPSLFLPHGATMTTRNNDNHSIVDINMGNSPQVSQMSQQTMMSAQQPYGSPYMPYGAAMAYPPHMYQTMPPGLVAYAPNLQQQGYAPNRMQQQQPIPQAPHQMAQPQPFQPQQRTKKTLKIVNPDTKEVVNKEQIGEDNNDEGEATSTTPRPSEPTDPGHQLTKQVANNLWQPQVVTSVPEFTIPPAVPVTLPSEHVIVDASLPTAASSATSLRSETMGAKKENGALPKQNLPSGAAASDSRPTVELPPDEKPSYQTKSSFGFDGSDTAKERQVEEKKEGTNVPETPSLNANKEKEVADTKSPSPAPEVVSDRGEERPRKLEITAEEKKEETKVPDTPSDNADKEDETRDTKSPTPHPEEVAHSGEERWRNSEERKEETNVPDTPSDNLSKEEEGMDTKSPTPLPEDVPDSDEERLRKLEDRLQSLELDAPTSEEITVKVYNRELLFVLREIVKELKHPGPSMKESLKSVGIDRGGMPILPVASKQTRRFESRDMFTPSWQTNNPGGNVHTRLRPPMYAGRQSDKRQQKKPPISRASMDRAPKVELKRAENAWKPRRKEASKEISEEAKYEKMRKEIRGILNKITPSTYEDLWQEFCTYKVYEDEQFLPMVIDLIFDKAVEEPKFCALYSQLCHQQVESELKNTQGQTKHFRQGILKKCQVTFEGAKEAKERIQAAEEELKTETDEKVKTEKTDELEASKGKEKRLLLGTIRFIAQLFKHFLITENIIEWCSIHLLRSYAETNDDIYIEYAVHMIETVGPLLENRSNPSKKQQGTPAGEKTGGFSVEAVMNHLQSVKDNLSSRVRFMIMNLDDLRKAKWQSRRVESGPKTIEEVHKEAKQEEIQNRTEREAYENKARRNDYDGMRSGPSRNKGYSGRHSIEKGDSGQRRMAAALAATSSGGVRKEQSLKHLDQQEKLGQTKPRWGQGAAGGGGASSNQV